MPSSDGNSHSFSLDAPSVGTIRGALAITELFILTLARLTRTRLSEVSYLILRLYTTYGVLLYMPVRLGHPRLILSEHRQPQSQCRVHEQLLKHGEQEVKASKKLFAREADGQQALSTFAHGLRPRSYHSTVCSTPHCGKREPRGQNTLPARVGSYIEGTLASRVANHQVLVAQQTCCILTANELDNTQLPPQELLADYKGHVQSYAAFTSSKTHAFRPRHSISKNPSKLWHFDSDDGVFAGVCSVRVLPSQGSQGLGGDL
jgi:hypothetical protein